MSTAKSLLHTRYNLSYLETGLLFAIILVLALFISYKARYALAGSENVMMDQTLNSMRLGLLLNVTQQELQGGTLANRCVNPMDTLKTPPANYLGAFTQLPSPAQARGHWYFDQNHCQLIYQWRFTYVLQPTQVAPDISRYSVKRIYQKTPTGQTVFQKLILTPAI